MQSSKKLGALWALGVSGAILLAGCGSAATQDTSSSTPAATSGSSSSSSAASSSSSSAAAVAAKVTAVTLPYNNSVFAKSGDAAATDSTTNKPVARFDHGGYALDAATAPAAGAYTVTVNGQTVTFQFPSSDTSAKNALTLSDGQKSPDITVTAGKYSTLYLLGAAGNGPAGLTVTLKYSDGTATAPAVITDWCASSGQSADAVSVWQPSDRIGPDGNTNSAACGLWVTSVKLDSSKTLTGLSFAALDEGADVTGSTPDKSQNKDAAANIVAAALAQ